jgi:hypothetical protein
MSEQGNQKKDTMTAEEFEKANPSVGLAYQFALASYDAAQKRLEVVERRLQEILGFAVTISLGVIAVHANKNVSFDSWLFRAAMTACLAGLFIGTYGRVFGYLILINPAILKDKYVELPESVFKNYFLHNAATHWRANADLVNRKGMFTSIAVVCFVLETILLILWSAVSARS